MSLPDKVELERQMNEGFSMPKRDDTVIKELVEAVNQIIEYLALKAKQ